MDKFCYKCECAYIYYYIYQDIIFLHHVVKNCEYYDYNQII